MAIRTTNADHNYLYLYHESFCSSQDTLQPMPSGAYVPNSGATAQEEWYPPGHGDVYQTLYTSGLLENLINQGKEYIFVSK